MQFVGRVALVTGTGPGTGKAVALLMAREGAKVGALSRTEDEINQVASEIESNGGHAIPLVAVVSDASSHISGTEVCSDGTKSLL